MFRINGVTMPLCHSPEELRRAAALRLGVGPEAVATCTVWRRAIDARKKDRICYVYTVDVQLKQGVCPRKKDPKIISAQSYSYQLPLAKKSALRPVVAGFGPAGMFAALILAQSGQCPIVLERGGSVEERAAATENFWRNRVLDPQCNVQFGEGGAGTFSDGKLNTGTKDPRIRKVLEELVACGAPEEILFEAKPHVGTDRLPQTVRGLRQKILDLGGEIRFHSQVIDFSVKGGGLHQVTVCSDGGEGKTELLETDTLVLAVGHSARDSFRMLAEKGIPLAAKPFSVGVRIEHLAQNISRAQYGPMHSQLPAADYKLSAHLADGRGVYTFCMCPGGQVVGAASQPGTVVTNGMSAFARDEVNSNAAVLVGLRPDDLGSSAPLAGVDFQEKLERLAFRLGGEDYSAPVQRYEDFCAGRPSAAFGDVLPTYRPGTAFVDLNRLLPQPIARAIAAGISEFSARLKGFDCPDALLTGPETRSSSPVRILRGEGCESPAVKGLYPCGEGAGYAGGIVSAAVDGIRCAEAILRKIPD